MNAYTLTIFTLLAAMVVQVVVLALSIEGYLHNTHDRGLRWSWLSIAIGSLPLALHHGYALELAMRTGLYDTRQAVLLAVASLFLALGTYGFRLRA
jgi:hypothetical protein